MFVNFNIHYKKFDIQQVDESSGPPPAVLKPLARAFSKSKLTTQNSTRSLNISFNSKPPYDCSHSHPKPYRKGKHSYDAINNIKCTSSSPKRRVTIDQGLESERKNV